MGDGIKRALKAGYKRIYSCDINFDFVTKAKEKFNQANVEIYNLPSDVALSAVVRKLQGRAVFFLDGHGMPLTQNSNHFDAATIVKGKEADTTLSCPILNELDQIDQSPIKNHIIMIDDTQCFGTWMFDGLTENSVIDRVKKINDGYIFINYENVLVCTFPDLPVPKNPLRYKISSRLRKFIKK